MQLHARARNSCLIQNEFKGDASTFETQFEAVADKLLGDTSYVHVDFGLQLRHLFLFQVALLSSSVCMQKQNVSYWHRGLSNRQFGALFLQCWARLKFTLLWSNTRASSSSYAYQPPGESFVYVFLCFQILVC